MHRESLVAHAAAAEPEGGHLLAVVVPAAAEAVDVLALELVLDALAVRRVANEREHERMPSTSSAR